MVSYIDSILAPDERVALTGTVTGWIWAGPVAAAAMILAAGLTAAYVTHWTLIVGSIAVAAAIYILSIPYIRRSTTDLVVTDRRVIVKYGLIRRETNEMRLAKIESIRIEQGVAGRILGYGTVLIRGVGGSFEPISQVDDPLAFKRAVEAQLEPYEASDRSRRDLDDVGSPGRARPPSRR